MTTGTAGGGTSKILHNFDSIISIENLFLAWGEFVRGKKNKKDVAEFSLRLAEHIYTLHHELKSNTYVHSEYTHFKINDPKPRDIHKASVRDRLVHHAIYRILYPFFDQKFIHDSYSCRLDKGTHRAVNRFRDFARSVSKNNTHTVWILKCDVRKFFASIDHVVLKDILARFDIDTGTLRLLGILVDSFHTKGKINIGLPLGNLTSQLLVNVYMNEFDQYTKHNLKQKYYIRYADDFVFMSDSKEHLESLLVIVRQGLTTKLKLALHPTKVFIKTLASGVDFLGWVHFPTHRVLRTATKKRMIQNMTDSPSEATKQSYRGLLKHGNTYKLRMRIT